MRSFWRVFRFDFFIHFTAASVALAWESVGFSGAIFDTSGIGFPVV
jgi:hypothetical protein